jgi:RimJ/RimL family protein N-acetyltransferase/GNAT superfamily N-acetyltransferase
MQKYHLRPAKLEMDFSQLAEWFSILEDEPTTETGLKDYYARNQQRIIQKVAVDERGDLAGFYWAGQDRVAPERFYLSLFVKPENRLQGLGSQLYRDMANALQDVQAKILRIDISDACPECRAFAERFGFLERLHQVMMVLDLATFDEKPYIELTERLIVQGFQFTSMAELGNTEEAQRKLYLLNSETSLDVPGRLGEHYWESFEDFQQRVCQTDWYKPAGQMVVIDSANGKWAAMSAITRLEGNEYAYNLHTGVDRNYRGRKLAQAVKVQALRHARDVLQAKSVHTHHNTFNLPMLAIDQKLGYEIVQGTYLMEKVIS